MFIKFKLNISLKDFKINRVIKYFVLSDLIFLGGWGLINPIFAIFVIEKIPGATLMTIGIASAIYWIFRSLTEIVAAIYLDKHEGEKDDFHTLIISLILAGFSAISFLLVNNIPQLFLVMFIQSLAFGLYTPSWAAIFSRHLDKKHYALDWSLDSVMIGIGSGFAGLIGGAIANLWDFQIVFFFTGILSFSSAILLFWVPNLILPKTTTKEPLIRDHTPLNINK